MQAPKPLSQCPIGNRRDYDAIDRRLALMALPLGFMLLGAYLLWPADTASERTPEVDATATTEAPQPDTEISAADAEATQADSEATSDKDETATTSPDEPPEGWQRAEADAPDPEVTSLSPNLIGERETDLQRRLSSSVVGSEHVEQVAEIARRTESEKTRYLALEALGNAPRDASDAHLMALYSEPALEQRNREQILAHLRPRSESDEASAFLLDIASDPETPGSKQNQALGPLVMLSIINPEDKAPLKEAMPSETQTRFEDLYHFLEEEALLGHSH